MSEKHAKILIVDDRPENIHAMRETLAPMRVEIFSAASGSEALKMVLQHDFSVVLMDVQMPEMDGFETAALMQKNAVTRGVPIIFVTAISKDTKHEYKGYESGAVDYIFKPVNPDILFSKVRIFVNLHKMRLENERMQQEMLKSRNLESLGLLAGGIAHEFNNILTAIMGNIELALMDVSPADGGICELLAQSQKASRRAQKLASRLLTFAKGGDPLKQRASLAEIVREAAEFILQGSKTACKFEFAADLWPVELDPDQFSQVIQNIVTNAGQAMPEGGIIRVIAENFVHGGNDLPLPAGNFVKLIVSDRGCGIEPENLERIFDPYFTTGQCGHGMGLSITHSVIKKHGGHILAQSEPGAGTTMTIYLPALKNGGTVERQRAAATETPVVAETPAAAGRALKVLVMDDEDSLRNLALVMLEHEGYEGVEARDGREALDIYQKQMAAGAPFDVVIMDLTIPGGMGGEEAIGKLLVIDPAARAIVASGYANDPVMAAYRDYGFSGMLSKPFQLSDLMRVVREVAADL
ncbi:MAG: response regulator [Deltaproteobacteria bacterium]|nr:response regulator [Deltaproteobacteria bacterium]